MVNTSPKKNSFLNQLFSKDKHTQNFNQEDDPVMDEKLLLHYYSSLGLYHPDFILVFTPERELVSQNQSNINNLLGYVSEERLDYKKILSKDTFLKLHLAFNNTLLGKGEKHEVSVSNKQGDTLYVDLTFIPIKNSSEEVVGVFLIIKDLTDYQKLTQELELKEKHLSYAQKLADIGSWEYNLEEDMVYFSENFKEIFGLEQSESTTINEAMQLVHPDDYDELHHQIFDAIKMGQGYTTSYRILQGKTNDLRYIKVIADIITENNESTKLIGVIHDVTRQYNLEGEVGSTNKNLAHIFNNLNIGIWQRESLNGKVTYLSKAMGEILCIPSDTLEENLEYWEGMILPIHRDKVFAHYAQLKKGQRIEVKYRIKAGDGTTKWILEHTTPRLNKENEIIGLFGMITDITKEIEMRKKLKLYSTHDPLTMLPNQHSLYEKLEELCSDDKHRFAVLYLDLDRFRVINDSLGYHVGDMVLKKIANRLMSMLPNKGYLARLNSNDFIVLIENITTREQVTNIAEDIIQQVEKTITVNEFDIDITTSIGISFFPDDGDNKKTLLETSHSALYQAKKQGKNNYQFYSYADDISSYKRYILERDMRKAIEREEFEIYYQPQVEPLTGMIKSAEALIRWQHKEWGLISPNEFIPLAEENHLINDIGDWVIKKACMQLREWKDRNIVIKPISVNISPVRFFKKGLVDFVKEQLEYYQISANYLEFEITESILLKVDKSVLSTITSLKELGIKIAIDDFGTGFSSLTYLRQFPADTLKIDKMFIQSRDGQNEKDAAIVSAVLQLAKGLDLNIVAEGVEEHSQLDFLEQRGCHLIQGYLFSKPVSKERFEKMLQIGYLDPTKSKIKKAPEHDRRKFYRFVFPFNVEGKLMLTEINKRKMVWGETNILIEDISLGGLKILTTLKLPIHSHLKFRFHFTILKEMFEIDGVLVWKNEEKEGTYHYGVQFNITESDKERLAKTINTMADLRKHNQEIPDTDFIQEDAHQYLIQHPNG